MRYINTTEALELQLTETVKRKQRERWLAENQNSIDAYNQYVEVNGSFGNSFIGYGDLEVNNLV